jgi:hypothetical protein
MIISVRPVLDVMPLEEQPIALSAKDPAEVSIFLRRLNDHHINPLMGVLSGYKKHIADKSSSSRQNPLLPTTPRRIRRRQKDIRVCSLCVPGRSRWRSSKGIARFFPRFQISRQPHTAPTRAAYNPTPNTRLSTGAVEGFLGGDDEFSDDERKIVTKRLRLS